METMSETPDHALPAALPADDACWRAVLDRDAAMDGAFVYAVRSTGIFCRPSCPSRRPRREQVSFFTLPEVAERSGFRACKRCRPETGATDPALAIVRAACRVIENETEGIPTLAALGREVGASPYHLQRRFKQIIGISPRQYGEALRLERLKTSLRGGEPVAQALYGAGYGSSSRLYEKAPEHLGMTPASYAKGGRGAEIRFTVTQSPLGRMLVAATEFGICSVSLGDDGAELEKNLRSDYAAARIERDDGAMKHAVDAIFAHLDGNAPHIDLSVDIRASAFQWKVWQRLRAIPRGETQTYGEIADDIGHARAARAVGTACASNPVALVVPCHRAVRKSGTMSNYRWGADRKRKLLEREHKDD